MVKTKIICTLGPASSNETCLRKMIFAGMDVARSVASVGREEERRQEVELGLGRRRLLRQFKHHLGSPRVRDQAVAVDVLALLKYMIG